MAETRAKFGYLSYNDMLQKINDGVLNAYDFVFCKDTKEYYIITENLEPMAIRARVYVFNTIEEAEDSLNSAEDTYKGQIVSILDGDVYRGYIVNNNNDKYTVSPLYEDPNQIDYDLLMNVPIKNLVGTLDNNIIVSNLSSGTYKIKGQYQIVDGSETFYLSTDGDLLIVDSSSSTVYVKRITLDSIVDFEVSNNTIVGYNAYITQEFLEGRGYATTDYVDNKTLALEESIKSDIQKYIEDKINESLEGIIDEKIDQKLEEKIKETTDEEVKSLF